MELRRGIPASTGIAIGEAFVMDTEEFRIPRRVVPSDQIPRERDRLNQAFAAVEREFEELRASAVGVGEAVERIIDSHREMLRDPVIREEMSGLITAKAFSAEYAVSQVIRRKLKAMQAWGYRSFATRIELDLREVERALLRNLLGERRESLGNLTGKVILVARNLSPTETAALDKSKILGILTETGGKTSHTSIVAASLGIPAVVGVPGVTKEVGGGDTLVLDGTTGTVVINPDSATLKRYEEKAGSVRLLGKELAQRFRHAPARTKDGVRVTLYANIELPEELPMVDEYGADGVGLFRTEYLYLTSRSEPTEEDHTEAYRKAVRILGDRWLAIRTLDLGADKVPVEGIDHQANPFLGVRAIRLCFERLDLLQMQLRAVLRAATSGHVGIMIPMISELDEILHVQDVLEEVVRQMREHREPVPAKIPLGIMVEVPAAALSVDRLAPHVDFFSLGTNDLIAYLMAVDRTNESVAHLYQGAHPSVLRVVKHVLEVGRKHNKPVSVCGEMASDIKFVPLLLGLGLRIFSVVPHLIPEIKLVLSTFTIGEAEQVACEALKLDNAADIEAMLKDEVARRTRRSA